MNQELNKLKLALNKTSASDMQILNRISNQDQPIIATQISSAEQPSQLSILEPPASLSHIEIERVTYSKPKPSLSASPKLKLIKLSDQSDSSCDEANEFDDEIGTPQVSSSASISSKSTLSTPKTSLGTKRQIDFELSSSRSKKSCDGFPSSTQPRKNNCHCDFSEVSKKFHQISLSLYFLYSSSQLSLKMR